MTAEICPYCRTAISSDEPVTACDGCSTRHHPECYVENGGCTIFGCRCAPAEEPKLSVSLPELEGRRRSVAAVTSAQPLAVPPPPAVPGNRPFSPESRECGTQDVGPGLPSMLNLSYSPVSPPVNTSPEGLVYGSPKNRTTFIVLGALLGAFGAHNFYAGYTKRALAQLAITIGTLGFGSPMSWIWAVIDICTINHDKRGVQFEY